MHPLLKKIVDPPLVTRDQFGISALVPQTLFRWESSGGVAKCRLFSQPMCQPGLVIYGPINPFYKTVFLLLFQNTVMSVPNYC